ncbi:MAG: hypothetical protein HY784_02075 [Chloroflexi bacterium]|nr:hypothetical protein [Chloroflexota bacterium]
MTSIVAVLQNAQFVVNTEGRPTAALLDIDAWEALLDWLEEWEDVQLARERLRNWKSKWGWTQWEQVERELDAA